MVEMQYLSLTLPVFRIPYMMWIVPICNYGKVEGTIPDGVIESFD
jgi:hypothetical protein